MILNFSFNDFLYFNLNNFQIISHCLYSFTKKEYFVLSIFLSIMVLVIIFIISLSYFLARQNPEAEKLSAYECGFDPYEDARHAFDIQFYVIAILFILFDIEIMFVIP